MTKKSGRTAQFNRSKTLVIYGRNAVHEALLDESLRLSKLHLAESNRNSGVIKDILAIAERRSITVEYKDRRALSFISKNSKQDQGVAADIFLPGLDDLETLKLDAAHENANQRFILLDGVTNPQNVGMIIRSVAAAGNCMLVLPQRNCADLGPLAIKASAGAVFRCPILRCASADLAANWFSERGITLCGLCVESEETMHDYLRSPDSKLAPLAFVLGNESSGISSAVDARLDRRVSIPMKNGVESLNVAVTAALIAYATI